MKRVILINIIILSLFTLSYANITKTVEPNGNGDYTSISAALSDFSNASDNWDILVWYNDSPSHINTIYYENNLTWNAINYHIRLISTSDITADDFDYVVNNELYNEERCIIDADENGRVFKFAFSHQTSDDVIYGFTMRNANTPYEGGAIYYQASCFDDISGLTISHCIFRGNVALLSAAIKYYGFMDGSYDKIDNLSITNCKFVHNRATYTFSENANEMNGYFENTNGETFLFEGYNESNYWTDSKTSVFHAYGTHLCIQNCEFINNEMIPYTYSFQYENIARFGKWLYYTYGNIENISFSNNYIEPYQGTTVDVYHLAQFDLLSPDQSYTSVKNIFIGEEYTQVNNSFNNIVFYRCDNVNLSDIYIDWNSKFSNIRIRETASQGNIYLSNSIVKEIKTWTDYHRKAVFIDNIESAGLFLRFSANVSNSIIYNNIDQPGWTIGPSINIGDVASEDCYVENVNLINIKVYNNENGGLYCRFLEDDLININIESCIFNNNEATNEHPQHHTYAGGITINCEDPNNLSNISLSNCTFVDNSYSGTVNTNGLWFSEDFNPENLYVHNCIFWDDPGESGLENIRFEWTGPETPNLSYSDIRGGWTGEGNIDADPLLVEEGNHLYHLLEGSPCIDAGDPTMQDPDSTRIDMGCYPTVYDVKKIKPIWNWVSFPRLPREGNEPVAADSVLENIEPFPPEMELELQGEGGVNLIYDEEWYFNGLENIVSTSGYKLHTSNTDNSYLPLDGSRLAPDTPITLIASDYSYQLNWIGYWLPQTQMSDVAFGDEWNNVWSIKAEDYYYHDGSMEYKNGTSPTYPWGPIPMEYGKAYLVRVHHTITDFQWNYSGEKIPPPEKSAPQNFTYTDKPDYEAIDIVDIDESIMEIGVFEDDICVGAAVVDSGCAQILAYTDSANRDENELTFQIVTGRGDKQKVNSYLVYDFTTGEYVERRLIAGRQECSIVRLGKGGGITIPTEVSLSQNAPNPFGYNTTISYALPEEAVVEIAIYNIRGQRVKSFEKGKVLAGNHNVIWNGKDDNSKRLGNGIYFYKLSAGRKKIIKKMLLMR